MEQQPHLQVIGLNVWYSGNQVLKDISISLPDRNVTAIIGPSGCGKTTLLKSFNRLIDLQEGVRVSGKVLLDGENIYGPDADPTHIRRKMGLLGQRPQVLPLSIYDNVAYGPRIHGIVRSRKQLDDLVCHNLQEASLWEEVKDRLHAPAARLSIGQQQRLCLARGLAVGPEIILADEPTSALDPISSRNIEEKFTALKTNYTIVVVTHILRQARRIADYLVFLYLGELIEHGPAREIFGNPKQQLTRDYIRGTIS